MVAPLAVSVETLLLLCCAGLLALAAAVFVFARRRERGARRVAEVRIVSLDKPSVDRKGAARSVQAADLILPEDVLDELWSPMQLERLARTYWRYLTRVTLGLVRVVYSETEPAVVLLGRPFVLLRFGVPEYELDGEHGVVRWRIERGLLVSRRAPRGEGHLEIDIRRFARDAAGLVRVRVTIEVESFYPAIAVGLSRWLYRETQSRIHVIVTHGFLRSLARLDLAESRVGRFA